MRQHHISLLHFAMTRRRLQICRYIFIRHDVKMCQKNSATDSVLNLGEVPQTRPTTIKFILLQKAAGI